MSGTGAETLISTFIGGEELRDGAVLGDIGIPLDSPEFPGMRERLNNVTVRGSAALFVAFQDATAEELEPLRVEKVLQEISEFIGHRAFPSLQQFIRP